MSIFIKLFEFINNQKKVFLALATGVLVIVALYLRRGGLFNTESIIASLENYPIAAPLIFTVIYALMIVFLVPTLPMNIGAGLLWGTFLGGIITLLSATTGASIAFLLSRYLAHDYFEKRFKNGRTWNWLQNEIKNQNWKAVAFTRANPAFPFGLLSYFFGLTKISFRSYFWSTTGFIFPGVFVFSAVGASLGGLVLDRETSAILNNVFLAGIFVALIVIVRLALKWYAHIATPESTEDNAEKA